MPTRYALINSFIQDFPNEVEVPLYQELPDLVDEGWVDEGWNGDLILGKDVNSDKHFLFVTSDVISESSDMEETANEEEDGILVEILYRIH